MKSIKEIDLHKNWHILFTKCKNSGQSIRKFCRIQGVSLGQFMYWRKKLILCTKKQSTVSEPTRSDNKLREIKISKPKFQGIISESIKVIFPNGINISLPINLGEEKLTNILSKIGGCLC